MKKSTIRTSAALILGAVLITTFQNCGEVSFKEDLSKAGTLGVCNGVSCDLTPLTTKPGVVTILIALGDESEDQLVVSGASSQLIAETVVRYASPVLNPKILVIRDAGSGSEDPEDTIYISQKLLARYRTSYLEESPSGITAADLAGFDLVWLNNPGAPMNSVTTRNALLAFNGGVIIQGDDLSRGSNFSLEELTGLTYVDNGVTAICEGVAYTHDNNAGQKYRVTLDSNKIPGADASAITFRYGNDIDNTRVARPDLEILAFAQGGPAACTETRPAIVRYLKGS